MRSPSFPRAGFSLLETVVALTLFAGVLLGVLGAGQYVLAHLHDSDLRFRATVYAESLADSLRGTACTRLTNGSGTHGPLAASWTLAKGLDVARVSIAVSAPAPAHARAGGSRSRLTSALLACPEP